MLPTRDQGKELASVLWALACSCVLLATVRTELLVSKTTYFIATGRWPGRTR